MRSDFQRACHLLTMGRSRKALLVEATGVIVVAMSFWILACAFVLLEPSPHSAQNASAGAWELGRASAYGEGSRPTSYALSKRPCGAFALWNDLALLMGGRDA